MIEALQRLPGVGPKTAQRMTFFLLKRPVDDLVYIDEMPVRGRTHPIKLWSLTADYVQKRDWESEVAKATPAAGTEPVHA